MNVEVEINGYKQKIAPYEFAQKFLQDTKEKVSTQSGRKQILSKYCPFCNGGDNKDTYTFAMNLEDGAYNCLRGKCGARGSFFEILRKFNLLKSKFHENIKKYYVKPNRKELKRIETETDPIVEYFKKRKINKETLDFFQVEKDEKGNIAIPYFDINHELCLIKYKLPRKPGYYIDPKDGKKKKEPKSWASKNSKPTLFNLNNCDFDLPLVICEGEPDCFAIHQSGWPNVCSIHSGVEHLECITINLDYLKHFKRFILWFDNDIAGKKAIDKISEILGKHKCDIVNCDYKDANDVLLLENDEEVIKYIEGAEEQPISGILQLSEVELLDPNKIEKLYTGFDEIDDILGGLFYGNVSLWTGITGSGKSTFLNQIMLNALNSDVKVFVFSGELPAGLLKSWLYTQMAGLEFLEPYVNKRHQQKFRVHEIAKDYMDKWVQDKFLIYDNKEIPTMKNLFEKIKIAVEKYGCRSVALDNFMTIRLDDKENNYNKRQTDFMIKLVNLADNLNIHAHLVAHPRKLAHGSKRITKHDISGSMDIINLCHNLFSAYRIPENDKCDFEYNDTIINILKNRIEGMQDREILFRFEQDSRRFYKHELGANFRYKWCEILENDY